MLDTTIQVERLVGDEKQRFEAEVASNEAVYTSSFVFREFLRSIIHPLEWTHRQIAEALPADAEGRVDLAELSRLFAKGGFRGRFLGKLHLVMAQLLDHFRETRPPKQKVLDRLERLASRWIDRFFFYGSRREIHCLGALDDAPDELDTMRSTRPFPPLPRFPARAADFLEAHREAVLRVEKEVREERPRDRLLSALDALKDADGIHRFRGRLERGNWNLGDLLIALEAPEFTAIYSTDKAFVPLCRALGKPLHRGHGSPAAEQLGRERE